ncbi:MAG: sulfurtransferase [Candidatus Tectomicrobia bacterium]|uniref:Sulfurtransferase n=1 Tax=Tectimicrobiota bacterium TaxID=2528274 RepID=A0A932HYH4_UNCTE|nr:sulfurtransferase [Candidatus Tectomicrobia bacterium]
MTQDPPLVSTQWLADRLNDPNVRVIEVSSSAEDKRYREGHIPGAAWFFWKDLCWDDTDREFLTPQQMSARLGRIGITHDATLVIYGDPVQFGTYPFWALTMAGHPRLRLLDGAKTRWKAEGRPMTQEIPSFKPADYKPPKGGDSSMRVGRDEVRANLKKPGRLLLDVRSPEEYSGERVMAHGSFDHGAERKGRIPGAVHLFYKELYNADETFKRPEELRAALERAGATPDREVVVYCRLSHRATLAWFAMRHLLGYPDVKIYDGSWTEWGSIVGFPVEK